MLLRPRPRHGLAAAFAVLLSVALHLGLIRILPPVPVGSPAEERLMDRLHAVVLRGVHRRFAARTSRPAVFRPEDPGRVMDQAVASDRVRESAAGAREYAAAMSPAPGARSLRGEDGPVAELGGRAGAAAWEARREILRIEQEFHSDEVSALPRRIEPAVPRSDQAPEVTWASPLRLLTEEAARLSAGQVEFGSDDGLSALLQGERLPGASGLEEADGAVGGWADAGAFVRETALQVTDLEPVERLLAVDLLVYRPADEDQVYFKVRIQRRGDDVLPVLPKDVLLIQDCSESMTQAKLNECKKGLHRWLEWLGPEDRFNIMGFRDQPYLCAEQWAGVTLRSKARARWFIEDMRSMGNTDIYGSLEALLKIERAPARPLIAVLVTDGRATMGVQDNSDIIERFTESNRGAVSVFAVGGGRRINRFLLDLIGYRNRGDSSIVEDRKDIPAALDRWAVELSRPVMAELSYAFSGLENADIYPSSLTHLYLDRPLEIYGRAPAGNAAAFQVVGRSGTNLYDMVYALDLAAGTPGDKEIRQQWAWHRVYALIGEHVRTRRQDVLERIQATAARYGLSVPYVAELPFSRGR